MSATLRKESEYSVASKTEPEGHTTRKPSPVGDAKYNLTSRSEKEIERRPSIHSQKASPLPEAATVLRAVEHASETNEAAATVFESNLSTTATHGDNVHDDEKHVHVTNEENIPTGVDLAVIQNRCPDGGGTIESVEDDGETVYPDGLQLGILTFGLCMATFTVALDNTIIGLLFLLLTFQHFWKARWHTYHFNFLE